MSNVTADMSGTLVPALDNTLGALYIGILLAMALWGVASLQLYYYLIRYPNDEWWIKALVIVVWILDTVHQGLVAHAGYIYMVSQYGHISFLSHIESSLEYMIIISAFTCLAVQSFLVFRVWTLSRKNVLLVTLLAVVVAAQFGAITAYFIESIRKGTFTSVRSREALGRASESLVVVSDFSVAASLIFYLRRSRTGFKRTETLITRLIIFTVNTGLSTSIVAALTLLFISLYPNDFIYVACFICISKLYVNSLFATLNSRQIAPENRIETDQSQSIVLHGFPATGNITSSQGARSNQRGLNVVSIKVDTDSERLSDTEAIQDNKHKLV